MILQKIAYPYGGTLEEELYIRRNRNGTICMGEERTIKVINSCDVIKFDTYFNTFSYKKWKKYTDVDKIYLQLELCGKARVVLTTLELHGFDVDEYVVSSEIVDSTERKMYLFEYPISAEIDALSFQIQPLCEKLCIYNGAYVTNVEERTLREVNISLAVCTYRRENYVRKNMTMLDSEVFQKENSNLHNHLYVYISDNGNTLKEDEFNQDFVFVKPNKNSGGSGGFSRGAIEAIRDSEKRTTHIILMDDDITFDIDALERNYCFLKLLKPEYQNSMLGGSMFRTDRRYIQHAAGETYQADGIIFNKVGYNMYNVVDVMRNEVEEPINYLGWWYCCIPVGVFSKAQYSLPLFVQFDDIEFSLRNKDVPKITLNGICCWHLPFDKKWSAFKNYYTIRNRSIVDCLYFKEFSKKSLKATLFKECVKKVFQFSYREANLELLAAEDFLKGPSWLMEQDPVKLNSDVIGLSDKLVNIDELPTEFNPRDLMLNRFADARQRHLFKRLITLNGWLLPAIKNVTVEVDDPRLQYMYRAKTALKYDINSGKGIVTKKDWSEAWKIAKRYIKVCGLINHKFDKVTVEYQKNHDNMIKEEFWSKFLNF